MSVSNPTTADRLRWICNTSADEGKAEIKRLLINKDIPNAELQDLYEKAMAYEIHGAHRKTVIVALRSALKHFTVPTAPSTSLSSLPSSVSKSSVCDVVAPSWDRARSMLAGITMAIRMSLAGQVMLGAELQQLKRVLGYQRGGDRRSNVQDAPLKSWDDLVKEELGISRNTADRMIESWEAAKIKLKKLGGQPALLGILQTPTAELDAIQRQTLESVVAKITHGETQKSLLEELKIVKCYDTSGIGGDQSAHRKERTDEENVGQLAFIFFETVAEPLQRLCTQPDRTAYYIAMAEQHPAELSHLEQLLESTLHDVRAAKARRLQPKP